MIEAYPLHWPIGYPRTGSYQVRESRFSKKSLAVNTDHIQTEVKRLGGTNLIISTNIELNKSGLPKTGYLKRGVTDRGVAVYFTYKSKQVVLACDRWDSVEDNMYAIALSIDAMRGLERWGVSEILERSFTGFQALPEPETQQLTCWQVLQMSPTRNTDAINQQYRKLSIQKHPDTGGSVQQFQELQDAKEQAIKYANS